MDVEGPGVTDVVAAPDPIDDLPPGQDPASVADQQFQQLELPQREAHRDAVDAHLVTLDVDAHPTDLSPAARELLQSLGQLLGVALENRRLDAKARELAVVQERSLVAQGLHDSLAQGLNFLNLQLQLLEDAKQRHDEQEIDEILPLLRTGVEDSYQDVRELLTNFRSRLKQGDLSEAISDTVERFRRQSGCQTTLDIQYDKGAPLAPDQQLQVLFVLQEALSNIRKHAQARHVQIRIDNGRDFTLQVQDDGQGYDPAEVAARSEAHVGLHIMRERAARLNAHIRLESAPGEGARVVLTLPASERQAA